MTLSHGELCRKLMFSSNLDSALYSTCIRDLNADGTFSVMIVFAVIFISLLMVISFIALLVQAGNKIVKAASGRVLTVYILLLLCQLWYSVAIIVDPEDQERVCELQPILQCIGAVGTSSVLFFRMIRSVLVKL